MATKCKQSVGTAKRVKPTKRDSRAKMAKRVRPTRTRLADLSVITRQEKQDKADAYGRAP